MGEGGTGGERGRAPPPVPPPKRAPTTTGNALLNARPATAQWRSGTLSAGGRGSAGPGRRTSSPALVGRGGVHDRQAERLHTRATGVKGGGRQKKKHSAATSPPSRSLPSRRPNHGIQAPAGVRLPRPQPTQVTPPATRATAPHHGPALSVSHLAVAAAHRRAFRRCSVAGGAARSAAVQRGRPRCSDDGAPSVGRRLDGHKKKKKTAGIPAADRTRPTY